MLLSIKKSFAWSFLEQAGSRAISMVVQIILARLLLPETFGTLAILLVVINIADSVAQSGLGLALIQKEDSTDKSYNTAFWLSLLIAIVMYILIYLLSPIVATFYNMNDIIDYLRVLGIVVLIGSINSIQRAYLQKSMDFKVLFKVNIIAVITSGLVGIACAFCGYGVWALIFQAITQAAMSCMVMLVTISWRPKFQIDLGEAKELFSYGWKICVTGIINVLYTGISELIIGKACNATELGYYSQGRKYPNAAISAITAAASNVLLPAFSNMKSDMERFVESLKKMLIAGTFILAPTSLFLFAAAEPLIGLVLTDKWLPSTLIFQLTFLTSSILMFQLVNLRAYMALGDSGLYMKLNIIKIAIGGIVICATAIITRNIYATALAMCLVSIFNILVVDLFPAKRMYGYGAIRQIKDQLPTYFVAIVAFVPTWGISFLGLPYIVVLPIQVFVFSVVYFGLSEIFKIEGLDICRKVLFKRNI